MYTLAAGTLDYSEPGHTLWTGPADTANCVRFELDAPMIGALKNGAALGAGVDHDAYRHTVAPVAEHIRASLLGDLN